MDKQVTPREHQASFPNHDTAYIAMFAMDNELNYHEVRHANTRNPWVQDSRTTITCITSRSPPVHSGRDVVKR